MNGLSKGYKRAVDHKPKTAKNRAEPRKMTPTLEMEFFWGVIQMGKL